MREILFRGKTEKGEWVYGAPFFEEDRCYIIDDLFICDEYDCMGAVNHWVIPETVGQYTGLTDKNGKKIFEGDILEFSDRLVVVFWHAHLGCWDSSFLKLTNKQDGRDDMSPLNWDYKSEVIGNIHDNPELLKGE